MWRSLPRDGAGQDGRGVGLGQDQAGYQARPDYLPSLSSLQVAGRMQAMVGEAVRSYRNFQGPDRLLPRHHYDLRHPDQPSPGTGREGVGSCHY